MKILVVGAGGFIARHLLPHLLAAGHTVVGVVRDRASVEMAFPQVHFVSGDLARNRDPSFWRPLLRGVDVVVNAAGILQGPTMEAVHVSGPQALYAAARAEGVKRLVLLSAISARADVKTAYADSKLRGEAVLKESGLPWVLLRPSLVFAKGSYGGTSLMRGLSALPWIIPVAGDGSYSFSPIHAEDLARTLRLACEEPALLGQTLEPVGPQTLTLSDLLTSYRAWLGLPSARLLHLPLFFMRAIAWLGDHLGHGPMTSTSLHQLLAGNAGDATSFTKAIGFRPRSLQEALLAEPSEVQDRWHARLFFLAPLVKTVLLLIWLLSGVLGLVSGHAYALAVTDGLGLPPSYAEPLRLGTAGLDLAVALLLLFDTGGRLATRVQLLVIFGYTLVLSLALPLLWLDPFGALLKNLPLLLLVLIQAVIGQRR